MLAGGLYGCALVTYETVVLFAPAMVVIVVMVRRRRWWPTLAVVVPAAVQGGITLILRSRVSARSPGYTTSFDVATVLSTFAKQVTAALPLSQWLFGAPGVAEIPQGAMVVAAVVRGLPVLVAMVSLARLRLRIAPAAIVQIGSLGVWMWMSSSALVAVTQRWQQELVPGQGYLSVT